jgi:hypothetical protein
VPLVLFQLLLRQGEDFFAYEHWHRHFNPVLTRALVVGAIPAGDSVALAQRSRDSLPWP